MRFASLAAASLLAACGARTGLHGPEGLGGAGGAGGAGGGGAGGGGGAVLSCSALVMDGPPIVSATPPPAGAVEERPTALALGGLVAVPFRVADAGLSATIRAPAFAAWGAWPADLGAAHEVVAWDFPGYVAAPGAAGDDLAVVHGTPALGGNPGGAFADLTPSITAGQPYPGGAPNQFLSTLAPGAPAALSAQPGDVHVVWQVAVQGGDPLYFLQQTTVTPPAQEDFPHTDSGCATARMRASALAVPGGHLVAFSTGREWLHCGLDDGVIGPPTRLQVERWTAGEASLGFELQAGEPFANVVLARAADDAWLVHQTDGSTAETVPSVIAVPLHVEGWVAGGGFQVVEDGRVFGPVAAAGLGQRLAIAWPDDLTDGPPTIRVRLFEASGALVAEAAIPKQLAPFAGGALSLAPSPAGDALVVAWQAQLPEGQRVVAARLRCE